MCFNRPCRGGKASFLDSYPHLTTMQSALPRIRENSAFQRIPCHLPDDYQPAVNTPWMLNILSDPKGCLWGAIRRSMGRKSLLCHLASVSKFSWNSGRQHSANCSFLIFFLHLHAFGVSVAKSRGSWGADKWASGRLESPENQQRVVKWQGRGGRSENRTEEARVLAPELHQVCAYLFTLKSKRFQMETFSFVFIISLLYWDLSG